MSGKYRRSYVDERGILVKACCVCETVLPYNRNYYHSRGNKKLSAYCNECAKKLSKKYNKTNVTRKKNLAFVVDGVEYKKCTMCEETFPHTFEYFDKSPLGQHGLRSDCRKCRLSKNREFSERKWVWQLYTNAKTSTRRYGLEPVDISEEYISELFDRQGGKCYWLGIPMIPSKKVKSPMQPSLDRLDRSRGYVKGNVILCCFVANFGRNENGVEEWKQFLTTLQSKLDYSQWK